MDEQESPVDFNALRAKFRDKEFLLGPPRTKPVVREKPKVIPPPLSPTHHLPSGARPSLLSSINQALESKSLDAPRVIFRDENKNDQKLLDHSNPKPKEKSDGKPKKSKEKLNKQSLDHKEKNGKKLPFFGAQKESTGELVKVSPPPKVKTLRKKNIFGFIKSSKTGPATSESILDCPTADDAGPAPLIPVLSNAVDTEQESIYSVPKKILEKINIHEPGAAEDHTPLSLIPEPPDFSPPPVFVPDAPSFKIPPPQTETPQQTESSAFPVSKSDPPSQNKILSNPPIVAPSRPTIAPPSPPTVAAPSPPVVAPCSLPLPTVETPSPSLVVASSPPSTSPPSPPPRAAHVLSARAIPSPPTSFANSDPPSEVSAPSPSLSELTFEADSNVEAALSSAVEMMDFSSSRPERPISALSALERAEDMNTGKRTPPSDRRILSALEKACKKTTSHIPPPEDFPSHLNPTHNDEELQPIESEEKNPPSPEPEVNGTGHRTASLVLHNLIVEGSDTPIALLVVPPPPTRRVLPDPETLGLAPEKPERPTSVNLTEFIPPPLVIPAEIPVPPEFSEPYATDATDVTDFDHLADAYTPKLVLSESADEGYAVHKAPHKPNPSELNGSGINDPEPYVHTEAIYGDNYQDMPQQHEQSLQASQEQPTKTEQTAYSHFYESNENDNDLYEPVNVKKKAKGNSGKKSKVSLKNPYTETTQEKVQEKHKTSRFSRTEKKHNSEKSDGKELRKKEKQRLEKEKKELKEKQDRERKEQKEREKRENEMKKNFSITGNEDALYQAMVNVTSKGRKHDLSVKSGDIISIIRTTNCPKGKWLGRDRSNTYGYVYVDHIQMDFKEIVEMGKKTPRNSTAAEMEATTDGRTLNPIGHSAESFTDDSEEWTCDDDDTFSPAAESPDPLPGSHTRTFSMPEMGNKDFAVNHQHSHSDLYDNSQIYAKEEALQKLATFLSSTKSVNTAPTEPEPKRSPTPVHEEDASVPQESATQEAELDPSAVILPPPDMYADYMLDSSLYSQPIKNLPR